MRSRSAPQFSTGWIGRRDLGEGAPPTGRRDSVGGCLALRRGLLSAARSLSRLDTTRRRSRSARLWRFGERQVKNFRQGFLPLPVLTLVFAQLVLGPAQPAWAAPGDLVADVVVAEGWPRHIAPSVGFDGRYLYYTE